MTTIKCINSSVEIILWDMASTNKQNDLVIWMKSSVENILREVAHT